RLCLADRNDWHLCSPRRRYLQGPNLSCRPVEGNCAAEAQQPVTDHLQGLDSLTERLTACNDLDTLLTASLEDLSSLFGYDHSFIMVPDEEDKRLFTVASHGFPVSGVGSEVATGEGIIGVAAAHRAPIRNAHLGREMIMSRAVRTSIECIGAEQSLQRENSSARPGKCSQPARRSPAGTQPTL